MSIPIEFREMLMDIVGEFFSELGPVKSSDTIDVISSIGFSGEKIKGNLSLGFDEGFLRATHPMGSEGEVTERDCDDWGGEIANQIIGRTKNRLLSHGVKVDLAIPTVIRGSQLETLKDPRTDYFEEWYEKTARIYVHFLAKFMEDIDFKKEIESESSAKEGDAFLF